MNNKIIELGRERLDPVEKHMKRAPAATHGMPPDFGGLLMPQNFDDDRIIYLSNEINDMSISHVIQQIFGMAKRDNTKPIYLVVSSYGGSVDAMWSLYDAFQMVKCKIY